MKKNESIKLILISLLASIITSSPIKTYAVLSIVLGGTTEQYSISEDKITGPFGNLSPNAAR